MVAKLLLCDLETITIAVENESSTRQWNSLLTPLPWWIETVYSPRIPNFCKSLICLLELPTIPILLLQNKLIEILNTINGSALDLKYELIVDGINWIKSG